MPGTSFVFDHEYESDDIAQLMSYTVLGETTSEQFDQNQVIVVNVLPSELTSMLSVTSGWTDNTLAKLKDGDQIYPALTFSVSPEAMTKMEAKDTAFSGPDDTAQYPTFSDDSVESKEKLQSYMNDDEAFTYADGQPTWLLKIPSLSITNVDKTDYTADPVASIFPTTEDPVSVLASASNASLNGEGRAVRNLFEQMVAANKIGQDGSLSLASQDTLDLFVNYKLKRTYTFKIDSNTTTTNSSVADAQFTIDGQPRALPTGAAGTTVEGQRTVKIIWRLVAA